MLDGLVGWKEFRGLPNRAHEEATRKAEDVLAELDAEVRRGHGSVEEADRLSRVARDRARTWCEEELLPQLMKQLKDSKESVLAEARAEVRKSLPEMPLRLPVLAVPPWAWALVALIGGFLGVIVGPRLMWLAWGNIEVGRVLGPPLGASALVALVCWLRSRPKIQKWVERGSLVTAGAGVIGAVLSLVRGKKRPAIGLGAMAASLVGFVLLLKGIERYSRTDEAEVRRTVSDYLKGLFHWCSDWTVFTLWNCVLLERMEGHAEPGAMEVQDLFTGLSEGLNSVRLAVESGSTETALQAGRQLLSELEAQGIGPRALSAGAVFEESLAQQFEAFGVVEPGDPVEVLRPAWLWGERVLVKGQVRRRRAG